ncbi:RES family NAD+ phosphorylase [Rhodocytophaga rosea]|uniref:RES family NAD+ phosphorylase n=1 Tax=Rhodocytophaga rosea TaxID=2704465 RepID=A0A6C0GSH7_9BACT|nr:RES family NAD+ phosphorylase [Rhodocytophaga rosea]QHT70744.1 RES family NAD+ phosphorylase [Rhodocytophaga rosea]
MQLFRITTEKWARDLSGNGGLYVSGRWHHKGIPVIYTATTRALAVLEKVVHVDAASTPDQYVILTLELPDDISFEEILIENLPKDWGKLSHNIANTSRFPASLVQSEATSILLADMGTAWLQATTSLALKVPSAILTKEKNVLLNPAHKQAKDIKIVSVDPFKFDPRLL